jgi:hypothetical protein
MFCGTQGDRTIFKIAINNGFDIKAFSFFAREDEVRPRFQTCAFICFTRPEDTVAAMYHVQDWRVRSFLRCAGHQIFALKV